MEYTVEELIDMKVLTMFILNEITIKLNLS